MTSDIQRSNKNRDFPIGCELPLLNSPRGTSRSPLNTRLLNVHLLAAAFLMWLATSTAALAQIAIAPSDPRIPVITYERFPSGLSNAAASPSIKVHGDGRVYIDCPPYMKPSGRYEMQLSQNQVDKLLQTWVLPMLDADSGQLQAEADAAQDYMRENGILRYSSDSTLTYVQVKFDTFVSKYGYTQNNYRRRFLWSGLQADNSTMSDLGVKAPQIQRFAKLEEALLAIGLGEHTPAVLEALAEDLPPARRVGPSYRGQATMSNGAQ